MSLGSFAKDVAAGKDPLALNLEQVQEEQSASDDNKEATFDYKATVKFS